VIGFRWKFTPIVIFANMETVDTIFCCLTPDDRQYKINVIEFHNTYRAPCRVYISTFQTQIILLVDIASWFFQLNRE